MTAKAKNLSKRNDNILLTEYQKAQDSAEHHDNLIWTVSSIVFAGLIALIGFVVNSFAIIKFELIIMLASILGIILIVCLWIFIKDFRYCFKRAGVLRGLKDPQVKASS